MESPVAAATNVSARSSTRASRPLRPRFRPRARPRIFPSRPLCHPHRRRCRRPRSRLPPREATPRRLRRAVVQRPVPVHEAAAQVFNRHAHVRLTRAEPDVPEEDVLEARGRRRVFRRDRHRRPGDARGQAHLPRARRVGDPAPREAPVDETETVSLAPVQPQTVARRGPRCSTADELSVLENRIDASPAASTTRRPAHRSKAPPIVLGRCSWVFYSFRVVALLLNFSKKSAQLDFARRRSMEGDEPNAARPPYYAPRRHSTSRFAGSPPCASRGATPNRPCRCRRVCT